MPCERKIQQSFPLNRQGEESQVKILTGYRPGQAGFGAGNLGRVTARTASDRGFSCKKFRQSVALIDRSEGRVLAGQAVAN